MPATNPPPASHPPSTLLGAFWCQETATNPRVPGQGLVEYALILVLIAIVSIGALSMLGGKTSEVFTEVNCTLSGGELRTDNGNQNSTRCVGVKNNGNGNGNGNN